MTGPRDWDKELAEIDKVIANTRPQAASPAALPAPSPRAAAAPSAAPVATVATRGRDKFVVWARALIGLGGAIALPFWPYGKSCGTMLYLYLLAALAVSAFGIWTMRASWTHRRGIAHVVGLITLLGGLSFAAFEIFEHTAFAATRLAWVCS